MGSAQYLTHVIKLNKVKVGAKDATSDWPIQYQIKTQR